MITILADHDIEGNALSLLATLEQLGWVSLLQLRLVTFEQVGLPINSSDRTVWRFVQANGMILLTNNRNMKEADSLEQTIRDENRPDSLPVLTIGAIERLQGRHYRERCATQIVEIVIELENHLGRGRVYIP